MKNIGNKILTLAFLASFMVPIHAEISARKTQPHAAQKQGTRSGAIIELSDSGAIIEPSLRMSFKGAPWDYEIRIALPSSYYKSDKSYPVLWVTDGSARFDRSVST